MHVRREQRRVTDKISKLVVDVLERATTTRRSIHGSEVAYVAEDKGQAIEHRMKCPRVQAVNVAVLIILVFIFIGDRGFLQVVMLLHFSLHRPLVFARSTGHLSLDLRMCRLL